ncbi:MAG: hypothetical protein A2751_02555 [Candidatus Doudnabacteria bacterium RIFCSPHIGHO2_01_FULL_46_14]|uniref:Uncharacterized protein n=1 Tax=Candidatus Doudnabacteria bacterium RIFCSPHIGHO2_01_FULL_46_14 TaxID=1817824 RepID=A0A1F5NK65_9BACT|nr:MAG: hypothetical protein A2751_02555 [Candidatus Doudnabacteria bacterium RIFCSPHIGHO2_01_FULL_46_14]
MKLKRLLIVSGLSVLGSGTALMFLDPAGRKMFSFFFLDNLEIVLPFSLIGTALGIIAGWLQPKPRPHCSTCTCIKQEDEFDQFMKAVLDDAQKNLRDRELPM